MKTFKYSYNIKYDEILLKFANPEEILFIDIETTGLSPQNSFIYIIGVGYYENESFKIIQWFSDSLLDEKNVISEFFSFSQNYTHLLHFNGKMFDIPFIEKRANKYNLISPLSSFEEIDIYRLIKPLKSVLGLQDVRQKTVEMFLNIYREDMYSGGELIPVYKKYTMHNDDKLLMLLLLHNEEDVLNMHKIIQILQYNSLSDISISYVSHTISEYKSFTGKAQEELLITYTHDGKLPVDFKSNSDGIYISYSNNGKLVIRIPIISCELKHFYEDTKNYYYLPLEDTCIHKSIASNVAKEYRKAANKSNCYTRHTDSFIPVKSSPFLESIGAFTFKSDHKSKDLYILKSTIESFSEPEFILYGKSFLA